MADLSPPTSRAPPYFSHLSSNRIVNFIGSSLGYNIAWSFVDDESGIAWIGGLISESPQFQGRHTLQFNVSADLILLTTYCLLLTTNYLLVTTHYSLLTTHYSPLTTHYSLLTTHYSLLTTHYLLLTAYYLLLTTYYLQLATYYLLLTTYYYLRHTLQFNVSNDPRVRRAAVMHPGNLPLIHGSSYYLHMCAIDRVDWFACEPPAIAVVDLTPPECDPPVDLVLGRVAEPYVSRRAGLSARWHCSEDISSVEFTSWIPMVNISGEVK